MKTKFILIIGLIGIISCSTAQKIALPRTTQENALKLILVKDVDDPASANWYVDGLVGEHSYRFVLDTGAGTTKMVADDYLSKFSVIGSKHSAGSFSKVKYDTIVVPNIQVGPLSKRNFKISRAPKSQNDVRNVLGMNFFIENAFHFLFEKGEVQLVDDSEIPCQLELSDLFLGENFHPYVDLTWEDNVRAKGVWDTGAGMTVFDINFVRRHPQLFTSAGSSMGTDSTGTQTETLMYEMKGFTLAGKKFPPTRIAAVDLSVPNSTIKTPMDFILGYPVLHRANWFFDFKRRKWAISKMLQ